MRKFDGLESFPFEEGLNCSMRVGGWHMGGNYMPIEPYVSKINGTNQTTSGFDYYRDMWNAQSVAVDVRSHYDQLVRTTFQEWSVKDVTTESFLVYYPTAVTAFPELHYRFVVARNGSDFYIFILIWPQVAFSLPCSLLSVLLLMSYFQVLLSIAAVLVFFMPVEGGERIGLCITLFLAVQFLKFFLPTVVPLCQRAVWIKVRRATESGTLPLSSYLSRRGPSLALRLLGSLARFSAQLFNYVNEVPPCLALIETIAASALYYRHKSRFVEALLHAAGWRGVKEDRDFSANVKVYADYVANAPDPPTAAGAADASGASSGGGTMSRSELKQKLAVFEKVRLHLTFLPSYLPLLISCFLLVSLLSPSPISSSHLRKVFFLADSDHNGYVSGREADRFMSFAAFHFSHVERRGLIRSHLQTDERSFVAKSPTKAARLVSPNEEVRMRRAATTTQGALGARENESELDQMRLSRAGFIRLCMKALDAVDLALLESAAETYLAAQRVEKDTADEFWNDVAMRIDHVTRLVVPPAYVVALCCVLAVSPHSDSGPNLLHWDVVRPGYLYVAVIFIVGYLGVLLLVRVTHKRLVNSNRSAHSPAPRVLSEAAASPPAIAPSASPPQSPPHDKKLHA